MKNKFKSLIALWLVLILSFTMIIPLGAIDHPILSVYIGNNRPYEDMYVWLYEAVDVEYTAGDKFDELFADYFPEYWNITGWERWGVSHEFLTGKKATYEKDGFISPDEPDTWYGDILFPIYTDLRTITKQPTAVSPTVEVNYPDGAEYQWYIDNVACGLADTYSTNPKPITPENDSTLTAYKGTYNAELSKWESGCDGQVFLDVGNITADAGDKIKITIESSAEDFECSIYEWGGSLSYTFDAAENAYIVDITSPGSYNPVVVSNSPFTAIIEVVSPTGTTIITGENSYCYNGVYNSTEQEWRPLSDSIILTAFKSYKDRIKLTLNSDDPNCNYFITYYNMQECTIDGNTIYIDLTDPNALVNEHQADIVIDATAPFTMTVELIEYHEETELLPNETESQLSSLEAGKAYYCVATWPDGFSLRSKTFEVSDRNGSISNVSFIPFLLLMRRMRYYDGDEMVGWQRVDGGEILEPLALEDKDGMTLEGWYIDKELTEKFDFTKPIKAGIKLYAKWVEAPVEEAPTDEEVPADEVITETEEEITSEETE